MQSRKIIEYLTWLTQDLCFFFSKRVFTLKDYTCTCKILLILSCFIKMNKQKELSVIWTSLVHIPVSLRKQKILKNSLKIPPQLIKTKTNMQWYFSKDVLFITLSEGLPNPICSTEVHLRHFFLLLYVLNSVINSIHLIGFTCWPHFVFKFAMDLNLSRWRVIFNFNLSFWKSSTN